MATEDLTTFVEDDVNNRITVTAPKCDVVGMRRDDHCHVHKSYGADHFGDFEHLHEVYTGTVDASFGKGIVWGVSDGAFTEEEADVGNDGIHVSVYDTSESISVTDWENNNTDIYDTTAETLYYLTTERASTTLTVKIYSDAARTTLVDTLSIVCNVEAYEYLIACASRNKAPTSSPTWTGYCQDFDIQEAAPPAGGACVQTVTSHLAAMRR